MAHTNLANFYFHEGFNDQAEKEYLLALRIIRSTLPKGAQPIFSVVHSNLALVYLAKGFPERAVVEIKESLGINHSAANAKDKFPPQEDYLRIVRPDQGLVNIYNNLGILFSQYKLYDYSRRAFEQAIVISPEYPEVHWNLGFLFWQMGKNDAARDEWEITQRLDPSNLSVLQWLAKIKSEKH